MTAPLFLIAVGATLANAAGVCPTAPPTIEVTERREPVQQELLGLQEIEELRDRYGRPARHRTLGFYASAFFYTVRITDSPAPTNCKSTSAVVELVLSDRHVTIAREAVELRCLSDVATQHYLHHAALNEQAFHRLSARVNDAVKSGPFRVRADAMVALGGSVDDLLRSTVEAELPAYDTDRREMQAEADNDAETAQIANACS